MASETFIVFQTMYTMYVKGFHRQKSILHDHFVYSSSSQPVMNMWNVKKKKKKDSFGLFFGPLISD